MNKIFGTLDEPFAGFRMGKMYQQIKPGRAHHLEKKTDTDKYLLYLIPSGIDSQIGFCLNTTY